jgi:hypothetical protein
MAIKKITPEHRIKALIMDYETTIFNKIIKLLNAEGRSDEDEYEMRARIRRAQLLHEDLRAWYQESLSPLERTHSR